MRIRKIRLPGGINRYSIRRKAKEQHRRVQKQIRKAMPTSGAQIGKTIEKKLSASQKVWRNVGIALFSQKALENVSHFSSLSLGILMIILTSLVLIFPTEKKALAFDILGMNFIIALAGLFIVNMITYAAMRLIGSKTNFKVFFSTVNTALFLSILVIALPAALVSFAVFSTMLRSKAAIAMFFSLIPFYNYLIYGWASESLAKLKGIKSILLALIALVLILFLNLLLQNFLV